MLPIIGMSQRFDFALTGGLTLAQVNGDQLAGYDKLGFEAGVRTNIIFTDRWDMVVELLLMTGRTLPEVMMILVPEAWEKNRAVLSRFFLASDGVWHHKRIDAET